ncbi:hypothetical protein [Saccharospirillum salsuginis]|uniref:MvaT DNA-binding domain-containing protein n=1 Tax=Saccharospirillum salsuginis TaxID=418750 RepID=A0A918KKU0_9GAMM|nr:hypothetical protein [Saccharospirillum salsuginis]GGX64759.1 hypothetical protein GCM10007392_35750 [Saccharospirillum salsuginis]
MIDQDLDQKIKEHEAKIEELRQQKEAQAKRMEGFEKYDDQIRDLFDEYGISEYDVFTMRAGAIVEWIKAQGKKSDKPEFYEELQTYFARVNGAKSGKRKGKSAKASSGPKLAIGWYEHPQTGERIEKKRRNPKTLDQWVEEFGAEEVQNWLVREEETAEA